MFNVNLEPHILNFEHYIEFLVHQLIHHNLKIYICVIQ